MRTITLVLAILGVIMLGVLGWRLTGGPLGPRSWAFMAATAAVLIAAFVTWRRPADTTRTTGGTAPPRSPAA